ncbi:MAG: AMP-binding protein, partial [Pseudomonadales bacterium]
MSDQRPLISGFLNSASRFPDRPALAIQDQEWSYAELLASASSITGTIATHGKGRIPQLVGVFGHRSVVAFSGIIGTLLAGSGYVPLNPAFPAERTQQMINRAGLSWIIAEEESLRSLLTVLKQIDEPLSILVPDLADAGSVNLASAECGHHQLLGREYLLQVDKVELPQLESGQLAYLLFTSGSTGIPKGVKVTQRNVAAFVDVMVDRYDVTENDRLSQTFDLTFDLSAFDMFVAWERGACVCCPTQGEKMLPAKYVKAQNLTIWFSVPSTAIMMKRLRMLKPD